MTASVIDNIVLSLGLNTYFIFYYYGTPYTYATVMPRVVIATASLVIEIAVLLSLLPRILPVVNKYMYKGLWTVPVKPSDTTGQIENGSVSQE